MKILIIKLNPIEANLSCNLRACALINGLLKLGNDIEVLTTHNNNRPFNNFDFSQCRLSYLDGNKLYTKLESVRSKNLKKIANIAKKILKKLIIFDNTHKIAKKVRKGNVTLDYYDLVISISDTKTSHIAAKNIILDGLKYNKWIQYWGDPLAIDITNLTIYPKLILRKVERKLFSFSDYIFYASPLTLEENKKIYKKINSKFHYIPTPYVESKILNNEINEIFEIGYFGDYWRKIRNIMPLYNAMADLLGKANLSIVGNSDIELPGSRNIIVKNRCNITNLENKINLYICLLNKEGTQIPGKLFYCSSTNKPILIILDGDKKELIREYFEKYNRFIFCENNVDDIRKAILNIIKSNRVYSPLKEFNSLKVAQEFLNKIN